VTALFIGIVMVVIYVLNRRVIARSSIARGSTYPMVRRMNTGIALCGVALIVVGLIFPKI
jgi:energy-converting hydrogenase Eha subunit E